MIWPYLFSLTLWKTVSCASPGDAALEVQLALWKQFLRLCSAPGPTLCALTGFSINKTLPLSPETLSSKGGAGFRLPPLQLAVTQGAWIWSSRAGAASSQSSSQKLPCVDGGAHLAQPRQVVTGDADSSSNSTDSLMQTPLPPFPACFCSGGGVCYAATWRLLRVDSGERACSLHPFVSSCRSLVCAGLSEPLDSTRGISRGHFTLPGKGNPRDIGGSPTLPHTGLFCPKLLGIAERSPIQNASTAC